jgi:hypothetical protein
MALESFRESVRLLGRMPLLWVPGILAGIFAAGLWLLLNATGAFFTSRLMVISALILLVFVVGAFVLIRDGSGDIQAMVRGGMKYYFRVLLPLLVICFTMVIIFILLVVTFGFTGTAPDPGMVGLLTVCVMIPTLLLSLFFDMAAVFEEKKVFESIQRSILLVSTNMMEVISFYIISALAGFSIIFALMIAWEMVLYEKLEPLTKYNETQMQAITPEQLMGIIGPDGIWVTAVVLFIGCLILVPLFTSYKACFFKKLISGPVPIQQVAGEYDSKGRWYKY